MTAPEPAGFIPLVAARSGAARAGMILAGIALVLALLVAWVHPAFLMAVPVIIILAVALLFSGRVGGREDVVVVIDQFGVFDARSMTTPIPWSDIRQIIEVPHRSRLGTVLGYSFIIDTDRPERFSRNPSPRSAFPRFFISTTGLIPTCHQFRDAFRRARSAGLLRSLVQ